jgi:hypothetical protein
MSVKTVPERCRTRNIKNKLVHLIHLGSPSHTYSRHRILTDGQRFRILIVVADVMLT